MAKPDRQAEFVRWFGPPLTGSILSVSAAGLACAATMNQGAGRRVDAEASLAAKPIFERGGDAVWRYAETRLALEQAGQRIGERDLSIAAHALALGWTVVTNDETEFARVPGLRWENWTS